MEFLIIPEQGALRFYFMVGLQIVELVSGADMICAYQKM